MERIFSMDYLKTSNRKVQLSALAYLPVSDAPSLRCPALGNSAVLRQTSTQNIGVILCKEIYFGSKEMKYYSVLVEISAIFKLFNYSKEICFWFAKAFLFVRICSIVDSRQCVEHF